MYSTLVTAVLAFTGGLANAAGLQSRGEKPRLPFDENTAKDCTWWYDSDGSDSCVDVPKIFGISMSDFVKWNPSITLDCGNFKTGRSYCVEVKATTTTSRPTSSPTTTPVGPTNGVETPRPTQPEITRNCNSFHLVQPGETCVGIASKYGIAEIDVVAWNPSANSDCSGLRAFAYACTGVIGNMELGKYNLSGWTVIDGDYSIKHGRIAAKVSDGGKALIDTTYNDFTMTMDILFESKDKTSGNIGCIFRASDAGVGADNYRGYYVGVDKAAGGIVIGRADKNWNQLKFVSASVSSFAVVKVRMTGDLISVYVNDMTRPLTTVKDATYRQGKVGVRAYQKAASVGGISVSSLVYDGFERQMARWTAHDGSFSASSNVLVSTGSESAKATMNTQFANFSLDATVFLAKSDSKNAGLLFRSSNLAPGPNAFEGYYTGIGADGKLILGRADGKSWTELQSAAVEATSFRQYLIRVRAIGSKIAVYLEDMAEAKISVTDDSYSRGMVGARLDNANAFFDSFIVQNK